MAPNEETDLSKIAQCFIHTECSVVLIGSQGLRKQPQVERLRWQTPWWISQQYMSILSLPGLSVIEQSPPSYTCSYLKYELITDFLDKYQLNNMETSRLCIWKKRALEGYKFNCGKYSRLHSLQTAITSLGISQDHSWIPNQLGLQELTESCYTCGYGLFQIFDLFLIHIWFFSSVQSLIPVWFFAIPWTAARQDSLSIANSQGLPKLMSIESVMPSSHLILCCPLLLLPLIPPSIRVFSNVSTFPMRWPKYWSFSFSISPSNKHPGLTSFRIYWLGLLAVQGTLKIFSNTTVQKHQFFSAHLSSQSNYHIHTWLLEKP